MKAAQHRKRVVVGAITVGFGDRPLAPLLAIVPLTTGQMPLRRRRLWLPRVLLNRLVIREKLDKAVSRIDCLPHHGSWFLPASCRC